MKQAIEELVKKYPNDEELGSAVRKYFNSLHPDTNLFNQLRNLKPGESAILEIGSYMNVVEIEENDTDSKMIKYSQISVDLHLNRYTVGYEEIKSITLIKK